MLGDFVRRVPNILRLRIFGFVTQPSAIGPIYIMYVIAVGV